LVEQRIRNAKVASSIPANGTSCKKNAAHRAAFLLGAEQCASLRPSPAEQENALERPADDCNVEFG